MPDVLPTGKLRLSLPKMNFLRKGKKKGESSSGGGDILNLNIKGWK